MIVNIQPTQKDTDPLPCHTHSTARSHAPRGNNGVAPSSTWHSAGKARPTTNQSKTLPGTRTSTFTTFQPPRSILKCSIQGVSEHGNLKVSLESQRNHKKLLPSLHLYYQVASSETTAPRSFFPHYTNTTDQIPISTTNTL